MSRFGLLLALLSLLFVCPSFSVADESVNITMTRNALGAINNAGWTRMSASAPWEGRAGGVVEWYTGRVRVTNSRGTQSWQDGSWLLMYGAGYWDCPNGCPAANEVWASGNKGATWQQVEPNEPYSALLSPQTVQDSKDYQWRIQGTQARCPSGESDVYMSTDGGYTWLVQGEGLADGTGRFLGTAVVDSNDNIYVWGGQTCDGDTTSVLSDMWRMNSNKRWTSIRQSTTTVPHARSSHGSVVGKYYDPTTKTSVDAMYIMMGYQGYNAAGGGNLYTNDVWVTTSLGSSTNTAVWQRLTNRASWTARGDSQVEITSKGIMVIVGGVSNIAGTERRELNDVWASLDGGYTWGLCSDDAKWDDRQFQYTAIDNEGYLYVMAGRARDPDGTVFYPQDVWRSTESFDDITGVSNMCGLIVPPCGVGLRCMPKDDGFVQGVWGVSCAACEWNPTTAVAAAPATMTMTYLFIAFLIASLVLAAALAYLVYRMRATGASSPIPLPASAQRWWNEKQGGGGLNDSLNKGNTSSEGDSMYNPLTIRDQM